MKKYSHIERWMQDCKDNPDLAWQLSSGPPVVMNNESVDLSSAYELLDCRGVAKYVEYIVLFSAKNPILYLLVYRWWLMFSVPKEMRKYLPGWIRQHRKRRLVPFWTDFAKYNPTLFLLWLTLQFTLQLFVKTLTAPVKAVQTVIRNQCNA